MQLRQLDLGKFKKTLVKTQADYHRREIGYGLFKREPEYHSSLPWACSLAASTQIVCEAVDGPDLNRRIMDLFRDSETKALATLGELDQVPF